MAVTVGNFTSSTSSTSWRSRSVAFPSRTHTWHALFRLAGVHYVPLGCWGLTALLAFRRSALSKWTQLIDEYLREPQLLWRAVAGMNREQLIARPVLGKWSTLEVVCHLADFDPILADHMKRVIAEERPSLVGADEQRFAAHLADHERDLEEELTTSAGRAPWNSC
jgi:hypothetical protein